MRKVLSLTLLLILSINSFAWRIEDNKLIIEEGDNLWDISHNLLAKGIDYKIIWEYNKDKYKHLTTNPSLIYDGMELDIPNSLLPFLSTNENCCPNDSLGAVIKQLDVIKKHVSVIAKESTKSEFEKYFSNKWFNLIKGLFVIILGFATNYLTKVIINKIENK